jgi:hypothetical protein
MTKNRNETRAGTYCLHCHGHGHYNSLVQDVAHGLLSQRDALKAAAIMEGFDAFEVDCPVCDGTGAP